MSHFLPLMNGKRLMLASAASALAAGLVLLRAQEGEESAESPPKAPPAKPYLVIAAPVVPSGNSSEPDRGTLEDRLNDAARRGYRVVGSNQNWIIMEHLSAMPQNSNVRRRVVLPAAN